MLTLFSIPKPFRGQSQIIQRNAIRSWTLLRPACEILLLGDDAGTAEVAAELNIQHIPHVARNDYGTPLLNDLFEKAEAQATFNIVCYVNADILLMSDFMEAIRQIVRLQLPQFLMVGQRWDVDVTTLLEFHSDWEEELRCLVKKSGASHHITGIDYFVFSKQLFQHIPAFAIGRTAWDNWLIYRARSQSTPVIDATPVIQVVHQNHDYSHLHGGVQEAWKGQEAISNHQLAGGNQYFFDLWDATHRLTSQGIHPIFDDIHILQRLRRQKVIDYSQGIFSEIRRFCLRTIDVLWRRLAYTWSK